jgi:hypothetical protein
MIRSVLIVCMAFFVLLQGTFVLAEDTKMRRNKLIWESMSPEEKSRVIQNYREWKSSPPQKREKVRRNYDAFSDLSAEERQKLRERYRNYKSLEPARREKVRERLNRIDSLPPESRVEIERRYIRDRERSAHERMKRLQDSRFWNNLSAEEKEIFKKLIIPNNYEHDLNNNIK